jgi:hypothetical protein
MNFDPQKFFIGLMDFFSILLPGALLTYLLVGKVGPVVLGDRYDKLAGADAWAAFLSASYLLGHLIFLLGFWLDEFYDWIRRYTLNTLNTQITLLACRGRLLPWISRVLIWLVFRRAQPCRGSLHQDQAASPQCLAGQERNPHFPVVQDAAEHRKPSRQRRFGRACCSHHTDHSRCPGNR